MTAKLAAQTQKTAGIPNGMRTATVTAISSSAITISVAGGSFSSGVGCIETYMPAVGDVVAVFRQDSSWLILGPTSAVGTPSTWTRFSALGYQSGWTDRGTGFPPGSFRQIGNLIQLVGQLSISSTPGSPSIIVTGLPATGGEVAGLPAYLASQPGVNMHIDASGTLRLYNATASGLLQFSCSYLVDTPIL